MNKISLDKLDAFKSLADLFKSHGFSLYLVGGTVRDYLLNKELSDMDAVSDATPDDMKKFLANADYTFSRFGSVKVKHQEVSFDLTTLREEKSYSDFRHPGNITFVKDLSIDVKRRDFTINALYMDADMKVIDFVDGLNDLNNRIIKMVGDPDMRIKEDPLRIIRALRFEANTGFILDKSLIKSINNNKELLTKLNRDKIQEEIRKCHNQEKLLKSLKDLNVL